MHASDLAPEIATSSHWSFSSGRAAYCIRGAINSDLGELRRIRSHPSRFLGFFA
jgi:hypothetical protein